jgi:putative dimethyl sulfoxide reductase chaperone
MKEKLLDSNLGLKEIWMENFTGEALFFGLLGKILYAEPDREWYSQLLREEVFAEAPFGMEQAAVQKGLQILGTWKTEGDGLLAAETFTGLRTDYFALFVGVGKVLAPPWESVYFSVERLLFQEQTLQVRAWYRRFGLELEKLNKEPDDHIGLELSFLAHLAGLGLQAVESGDEDKVQEIVAAQRDFLSQHLLRWASKWNELVQQHAQLDFYKGIALLVHGAVRSLASRLDLSVPLEV